MYAYFNELSAYPHAASGAVMDAIEGLADTCRALREYGVKKIACQDGPASILLSDTESLHTYCATNKRNIKAQLLLSVFTRPYLKEDSREEERFVELTYYTIVDDKDGETIKICNPLGLSSAHICDSFVVSFGSTDFWSNTKAVPLFVGDGMCENVNLVENVSEMDDLDEGLRNLIASKTDHKWNVSSKSPDDKVISLSSDHHGNDKLRDFAKNCLRRLEYFEEVSTSLEYAPKWCRFVKAIHTDTMQIDVVLYEEERGYSMRIKTTARNDLELRQMAFDLETRFGVLPPDFTSD